MDYEDFNNLTSQDVEEQSIHLVFQEIIFTLFVVIGITADIAIIYTIVRFKILHTTPNILLANWALADIFSLLFNPSSYRTITAINQSDTIQDMICILFQADLAFHNNAILFIFSLLVDWCISAYFPRILERTRKYYKIYVGILWTFVSLYCILSARFCLKKINVYVSGILFFFDYLGLFLFVIIIHIVRAIRRWKLKESNYSNLMLIVGTSYTLCWVLGFLDFVLLEVGSVHPMVPFLAECCTFLSAIIILYILYRLDRDFEACFLQLFKRPKDRYENIISDQEAYDAPPQGSSTSHLINDGKEFNFESS